MLLILLQNVLILPEILLTNASKDEKTIQIVRALSGSVSYAEALRIAKKAAPSLRLTVKAFMELRRNR